MWTRPKSLRMSRSSVPIVRPQEPRENQGDHWPERASRVRTSRRRPGSGGQAGVQEGRGSGKGEAGLHSGGGRGRGGGGGGGRWGFGGGRSRGRGRSVLTWGEVERPSRGYSLGGSWRVRRAGPVVMTSTRSRVLAGQAAGVSKKSRRSTMP